MRVATPNRWLVEQVHVVIATYSSLGSQRSHNRESQGCGNIMAFLGYSTNVENNRDNIVVILPVNVP